MVTELPSMSLLVLTEGQLGPFSAKTAASMMRYCPDRVRGVIDSEHAGKNVSEVIPGLPDIPVFASIEEAKHLEAEGLLIGIAPVGGELPPIMRRHIVDALGSGLSLISGLHTRLSDDVELARLADTNGATIYDVRDASHIRHIGKGRARQTKVKRVLMVGTDCNVGKMSAGLELRRAAVDAGLDAAFAATGQTGIMIEGWGIAVDHVLSDFVAGAAELLVQHVADRQICIIEGQGSLDHPSYSAVTAGLLHGSCPDAMIICHHPGRTHHHDWADCPIAPLADQIALCEQLLAPVHPGRIVGVALNTFGLSEAEALATVAAATQETRLPACDPIRSGPEVLLEAIRRELRL
jgi:uncharacterized NAD-dependent epimerase/dehydratase family protein